MTREAEPAMKRWTAVIVAAWLFLGSVCPLLAAEAGGEAQPSSPLYEVNQGLISGIVTIVVFLVLVAVLGKYAWGPILSGLKAREEKIRKEIADAEATRAKAEATLREYSQQLATAEQ